MNAETVTLSRLDTWLSTMRQASMEAQKERERIKRSTLGWKDYCRVYSISKPTLIKRRNLGEIPFVMLGSEFRYLIPVKNNRRANNG